MPSDPFNRTIEEMINLRDDYAVQASLIEQEITALQERHSDLCSKHVRLAEGIAAMRGYDTPEVEPAAKAAGRMIHGR